MGQTTRDTHWGYYRERNEDLIFLKTKPVRVVIIFFIVYSQPIMVRGDPDLLPLHFLPILRKSLKKIRQTRDMEEHVRIDTVVFVD